MQPRKSFRKAQTRLRLSGRTDKQTPGNAGPAAWKGQRSGRKLRSFWNRQALGWVPPEPTQPPDGTNRRHKLAQLANGRCRPQGMRKSVSRKQRHDRGGVSPGSIGPDATSITMRMHPRCASTRGVRPAHHHGQSVKSGEGFRQRKRCQAPVVQVVMGSAAMPAPFALDHGERMETGTTRRAVMAGSALTAMAMATSADGVRRASRRSSAEEANLKLVQDFCATWGGPDFDPDKVIPRYFADDAKMRIADSAPLAIGPAAGAAAFKPFFSQGQRIRIRYLEVFTRGPLVMTSRIDTEITPGKPDKDWPMVGVFVVKDGKIHEWTDFVVA
jgi:limonene-1,2-epoxide hydrolase